MSDQNKTKFCNHCKQEKPVSAFSPNNRWCKECRNAHMRRSYAQANRLDHHGERCRHCGQAIPSYSRYQSYCGGFCYREHFRIAYSV